MKQHPIDFTFRPRVDGPEEEIELLVQEKVCAKCKEKQENIDDLPLWD